MAELISVKRKIGAKAQYQWNRHFERYCKWLKKVYKVKS